MQQQGASTLLNKTGTFHVQVHGAESEQSQYQRDVFQTLLKWVAGLCGALCLAYLVVFIQQEALGALVICLTFAAITSLSVGILLVGDKYTFTTKVRLWLSIASWTVLAFGLFQHSNDNFVQISSMGGIVVIVLAIFLEPMRVSYRWAFLQITSYIVIVVTRTINPIPPFDLGVLSPIVAAVTPIVILMIITELGRVTTQHFKFSLIQSEARRTQLEVQERQLRISAAETEEARSKAERSDRVKSAFLASMSHELRTPLNSVINFTHFVIDGDAGEVNEKQKDLLDEVVHSAQHLLDLINDVLDISKIEAGSLNLFIEDDIDVSEIINSVASMARSLLTDKPIELKVNIDDGLPRIRGDQQRIFQILLNLMSNACKFTEAGRISVSASCSGDKIVLALEDSGPGIPVEEHEKIFEPFKQTKGGLRQGSGGTGLGLPIAKSLAEAHGGHLWLQSELGKGATFYISLPIKSEQLELLMA
jgi:signal transduction histidine kinase